MQITLGAWVKFAKGLHLTSVGYMYVSEHHLMSTDLKACMRLTIRANRPCEPKIRIQPHCIRASSPGHTLSCLAAKLAF